MVPIIIPAYEPDARMIKLIEELNQNNISPIIIVDDGSGADYEDIFVKSQILIENKGGILLRHNINQGKGRALKTAFEYVYEKYEDAIGVITVDSDGQHGVSDILNIKEALINNSSSLVLGVREFELEGIPWKSRMGNTITKYVFKYVSGKYVSDTQTGLRGIPYHSLPDMLEIEGERFEYEMRMLLKASNNMNIIEVPIKTIYDSADNHQTHFDPFKDSIKIYKILLERIVRYAFSSLSSCILDLVLFSVCIYFFKNLFGDLYIICATVLARICSAIYNYVLNYKFVFDSKATVHKSLYKYFILAAFQMMCSALLVTVFCKLGSNNESVTKICVDTLLFFVSYFIQQKLVFSKNN